MLSFEYYVRVNDHVVLDSSTSRERSLSVTLFYVCCFFDSLTGAEGKGQRALRRHHTDSAYSFLRRGLQLLS